MEFHFLDSRIKGWYGLVEDTKVMNHEKVYVYNCVYA